MSFFFFFGYCFGAVINLIPLFIMFKKFYAIIYCYCFQKYIFFVLSLKYKMSS